jgi:tRNA1Val (adenine37-N6)-methyltransferase
MPNQHFRFKQFLVNQGKSAFKVGTDGVLTGAWADVENVNKLIDIGTGTGLIALMLAQRCDASIVAIEPDVDSYEQAVENIMNCRWAERIRVENTDFQTFYKTTQDKFDLIVTNPPYFSDSLKNPDKRKAGTRHNTLLTTIDILTGTTSLLAENGKLVLILPYTEGNLFIADASSFGLYCSNILKVKTDLSGPVKRLLLEFRREKLPLKEKFLTIERGRRHDYTDEYIELTKDFYLKF